MVRHVQYGVSMYEYSKQNEQPYLERSSVDSWHSLGSKLQLSSLKRYTKLQMSAPRACYVLRVFYSKYFTHGQAAYGEVLQSIATVTEDRRKNGEALQNCKREEHKALFIARELVSGNRPGRIPCKSDFAGID